MTASRAAFLYAGLTTALWALLPSILFPNPPLDVVEGFAWGRELTLGYTKHPPMQAWLLELSYWVTGGGVFGAYWLSALCFAAGYACIWALARRLGQTDWAAFWAIVLTSVTFYFTLPAPEFNPNILQIPIWAGMILMFHRAVSAGRLVDWALLGALAAFGLYTKYFVALLIGTIGLYTLLFPTARRWLRTPGPWLTAAVCAILMLPHLFWLIDHDFLTFSYAASRSRGPEGLIDHFYNPLNFLGAQIANHAGLFLVVLAGLGLTGLKLLRAKEPICETVAGASLENDRFLLWFAFVPLAVVLAISAVTGNEFKHMWGTPMFVLSGVVATRFLGTPAVWPSARRALLAAVSIQAIFLTVIIGQALLEPHWKEKQTRIHYPGKATAIRLEEVWQTAQGTPLRFVAGDMWTAAHVTVFAPGRPSMFYSHDTVLSPWIDLNEVQDHGLLIVWRGDREIPPPVVNRRYPDLARHGSFTVPYQSSAEIPPAIVNWAIVPPGSVATHRPE